MRNIGSVREASMKKTLICRRCKVSPEFIREKGHRQRIRCPTCRVFGDYKEVIKAATNYLQYSLIDDASKHIARSMPRSKFVNYIPHNSRNDRSPEFIFK